MKKGIELELDIVGIDYPNKPFGIYEDRKIYPQGNFAVGSKVRGIITRIRSKKVEMKKVEVIEKSPFEIDPQCPHFSICGGCSFQNLEYDDQISLKTELIKKMVDNVVREPYILDETIKSPREFEYRNKMEFSFGNEVKDGPLTLGMHKKNSFHDVITVSNCTLMDADFRKILNFTKDYFTDKNLSFYHRMSHIGYLRNMVIRKGEKTGEISINLVTTSQENFDLSEWVRILLGLKLKNEIKSVIHTVNDNLSDSVEASKVDKETILYGNSRDISERLFDLSFKISPYSFFQTNSECVELLYGRVMDYMEEIDKYKDNEKKEKIVFDLFSGTGTIGQIVSKKAGQVYGIELIEEAVTKANENAAINGITNAEFIAGDVFKKLDEFDSRGINPDIIIIDPPRSGVGEKTVEKLVQYDVDTFIYVSCNPKTFALDLKIFQDNGYKLGKLGVVDMFPQTPHAECVAVINRV